MTPKAFPAVLNLNLEPHHYFHHRRWSADVMLYSPLPSSNSEKAPPSTLTLHMYLKPQAGFCDAGGHYLCLAPVGPRIFAPHNWDLELWGGPAVQPQHLVISEEAELVLDIWFLWRELHHTGQDHRVPL